jgi:D-arabinose 5-phosphate isomerase GutQ/beta-phosphoglucomutase-like phosphatase (HAD superfamily)
MSILDFDLYIFDFDGTLMDTEPSHLKAWNLALSDFFKKETEILDTSTYQKYFHSLYPNSIQNFMNVKYNLDYSSYDDIYKLKQIYYENIINSENIGFVTGAYDFLKKILELKKKFIVVTNTSLKFINIFKEKYPILAEADSFFTKDLFINRKPNPECYMKIKYLYPSEKKIGFEDSLTGMSALYKVPDITPVLVYDRDYYHNDYMMKHFENMTILHDFASLNIRTNCLNNDSYSSLSSNFIESILYNNIQELQNNSYMMKMIIKDMVIILENIGKNGHIYLSGMGKSGYVCKKSASTWQSLSVSCSYVDLPNLPHGDFGLFRDGDILILISNSGNTEEIVYILNYIKNNLGKKITTISIVANKDSAMEKLSTYSFVLQNIKEADKINMTPSTSSLIFMALLDAIGIALKSDIKKDEFKLVHPAGALGLK